MAYRPRYTIVYDGCSFHVTWQCHNRDWLLSKKWAKRLYYGLLLQYKDKYGVQFHAYQLMENHPHLVGTMTSMENFSAFFRVVKKSSEILRRRLPQLDHSELVLSKW